MEESPVNQFLPTLVILLFFMGLFGVVYPSVVTLMLQSFFPYKANGSLIVINKEIKGSELIGQPFLDVKYFWSRPSATLPPYNASASQGSNLAATNVNLLADITKRVELLSAVNDNTNKMPVDLATASGSGLDPHISVAAAFFQMPRIAKARHLEESVIQNLIEENIEDRQLCILGEPRINVVKLNLKLEERSKA